MKQNRKIFADFIFRGLLTMRIRNEYTQLGMTGFQTFLACILRWASFRTRSCRPETSLINFERCTSTFNATKIYLSCGKK